jgi:hypothetical protein
MLQSRIAKIVNLHKNLKKLKSVFLQFHGRLQVITPFIIILCIPVFTAPSGWILERDSQEIKVYTNDVSGSDFKEFKVEITVKSTLAGVLKIFNDVPSFTGWLYNCVQAKVLKKINSFEFYTYSVYSAPWPMTDRDAITHYVETQDTSTNVVTIRKTGVKNYIPEKEEFVRVKSTDGTTTLTPLKNGYVKIVYQLHVDPGGSAPSYLINFFVTDAPFNSFVKFKELIIKPENYSYTSKDIIEP